MSLLMEALRKAEEAKSKADLGDHEGENVTEQRSQVDNEKPESDLESAPETINFEATPIINNNEVDEELDDLELFSAEDGASLLDTHTSHSEDALAPSLSSPIGQEQKTEPDLNSDIPAEIAENERHEAVAEATELDSPLLEKHHKRSNPKDNDKQAISALFQAKAATQKQQKRKYRIATISLILLLGSAGGLYWYLGSSESTYNIPTAYQTADRGFLDDQPQINEPLENADLAITQTLSIPMPAEGEQEERSSNAELTIESIIPDEAQNLAVAADSSNSPQTTTASTALIPPTAVTSEQNTLPDSEAIPIQERMTISFTRTQTNTALNPQISAAYSSLQNGNLGEALTHYQEALVSQPNDRDAMLGLASIYTKRGETVLAQNMYARILRLNPKDPIAQAGLLGNALAGDPVRQELELKNLIDQHPDVAPLAFALGNLYASQNRWTEAQNAYFDASVSAKSGNEGPVSPDYAFNLAISLERLNQSQAAYTFYQEALELSRFSISGFEQGLLLNRIQYLEQRLP